jgi:signal transduction histidine kinase
MKELIQNLLHYAQLGQGDVVETPVHVKDLINQALQNLRTLVEKSGAQITIHSEVETVQGDPVQLVQLVQNLLSNALKFTESGKPVIEIRCRKEGGQVRISVSDNGIGIAEADMNKVFEIFRRLNTKKDFPGTGIGLAICKKIVDRHRGRIWPESEPGKGTTFHFTLTADKAQKLTAA